MMDDFDQKDIQAAATLLAMQAMELPEVNIDGFPILPEAPQPIAADTPPRVPDPVRRAAVDGPPGVPDNLQELAWGARRRRSVSIARPQHQSVALVEWGARRSRSGRGR
ncbi:hypothetical protein SLA2020_020770 [Shorea laevis]